MKNSIKETELLTIEQLRETLPVSRVTILSWRKKGIIPYIRINSRIYFRKNDIEKMLESRTMAQSIEEFCKEL